ncbi:DUF262 domain-containing protein [Catalinimonas niigatensis]|uniref:DUF262 domain-containing protein n=1 Tax=Catalinimonas niigatensis TaxID=1397264 RepID=UPI0026650E8B|nr:DUF262 domain-containing protein [Catalinimonas niigatensis]WPP48937.1 DUF262 domain-containing protein [Catalinimonas niigatensis]
MSNEGTYNGDRMSFYRLFTQDRLKIEIPKIQRDYAQGRPKMKTVRTKFLSALSTYLQEGQANRDLDFIYGNITTDEDGNKAFIPLDGQQRLTTLFLLHWYLAQLSDQTEHLRGFLLDHDQSRFTYETRASSREFCNALLTHDFDIEWQTDTVVSKWIRNQGWYFTFWDNDPTVSSMLTMIDEIHHQFSNRSEYYELLISEQDPIITFQFLNLEEFNLTDDLYIKMNSRGKPLTPFENFKAKFEGEINRLFEDVDKAYPASWLQDKLVSPSHYFSYKIDTVWLNHFWKLSESNPDAVDGYLMNFIRTILSAWYAGNNNQLGENELTSDYLQRLVGTRKGDIESDLQQIDFFFYEKIRCITSDSVIELISAFDALVNIYQIDIKAIPKWQFDSSEIQTKVVKGPLTIQERLLFHAFIQFLILHNNDIDTIGEWMRVAFNLIENTRMDFEQLESIFEELDKLLINAPNILDTLCDPKNKISAFYSQQVIEERIKAHLILKGEQWSSLVKQIESDDFNRGQIGYLLEFSGIWSYYKENDHCGWADDQDTEYYNLLNLYGSKASAVLPYLQTDLNNTNVWERAVLTKGDYLIPASSYRYNFLHSTANQRDYSWKRFLRLHTPSDTHFEHLAIRRPFVKEVLDDARFDVSSPWESLAAIAGDGAGDWRSYFIQQPELMHICEEGFIRYGNDHDIRILRKKQFNSYHFELYTYAVYSNFLKDQLTEPIGTFKYSEGYGWDLPCYIKSEEWVWKKKTYHIRIYYGSENSYELIFSKTKGDRDEDAFADELRSILRILKFNFDSEQPNEWKGFYRFDKTEKDAIKSIKNLCSELNQLTE